MFTINQYKDEIVEAVRNHDVTIITAETGAGKSTQVPQYLAEWFEQVIVTEPRTMAAKSLACYVAEEMQVTLGNEVGYRTAYDRICSRDSGIIYCTDGLQLVRTLFGENERMTQVLIIDEVHEWNLNIEVLIAWCKQMKNRWKTKIVIMSATINSNSLAEYFGNNTAIIDVPGKLYDVEYEKRSKKQFLSTIMENIHENKNILVFVPGKKEIEELIETLSFENAVFIPLHGEMEWEVQKECFKTFSLPKVIVATNVAQTSITIPDIDVVIDTGDVRVLNVENGIEGLTLTDASQSDILQRKGRAGRTKHGKYFLCSDKTFEERPKFAVPEIKKSILDKVVLQLAAVGLDAEVIDFYHKPELEAIKVAKKELVTLGALNEDGVTEIGYKMAKIPLSVKLSRMIIEAEKYGVTEQVMTIAAIIEMGGLLDKGVTYKRFTSENKSDLLAELDVWNYIARHEDADLEKLKIHEKKFDKIVNHVWKLRETLEDIVGLTQIDDRNAILKSCIAGMITNVYVRDCNQFKDNDGISWKINYGSCVSWKKADVIVAIPRIVEYADEDGRTRHTRVLYFASKMNMEEIIQFFPDSITSEEELSYEPEVDAIKVTSKKCFRGCVLWESYYYDFHNSRYNELKKVYETSNTTKIIQLGANTASEDEEPDDKFIRRRRLSKRKLIDKHVKRELDSRMNESEW